MVASESAKRARPSLVAGASRSTRRTAIAPRPMTPASPDAAAAQRRDAAMWRLTARPRRRLSAASAFCRAKRSLVLFVLSRGGRASFSPFSPLAAVISVLRVVLRVLLLPQRVVVQSRILAPRQAAAPAAALVVRERVLLPVDAPLETLSARRTCTRTGTRPRRQRAPQRAARRVRGSSSSESTSFASFASVASVASSPRGPRRLYAYLVRVPRGRRRAGARRLRRVARGVPELLRRQHGDKRCNSDSTLFSSRRR